MTNDKMVRMRAALERRMKDVEKYRDSGKEEKLKIAHKEVEILKAKLA